MTPRTTKRPFSAEVRTRAALAGYGAVLATAQRLHSDALSVVKELRSKCTYLTGELVMLTRENSALRSRQTVLEHRLNELELLQNHDRD